jgi:hypothetical protein
VWNFLRLRFFCLIVLFRKIRLKIRFVFTTLTINDYTKFKFRAVCKNRILKCEEYKTPTTRRKLVKRNPRINGIPIKKNRAIVQKKQFFCKKMMPTKKIRKQKTFSSIRQCPCVRTAIGISNRFVSDFHPNTRALSASADRCFGETSPTNHFSPKLKWVAWHLCRQY